MTTPTQSPTAAPIRVLKMTMLVMMAALVVVGLVFGLALPTASTPPAWALILLLGLGGVAYAVGATWGFAVPTLAPGMPADETASASLAAFTNSSLRRFFLAEVVAIVGVVLAVAQSNIGTYLVAALVALAVIVVNAWPTDRTIAKVQGRLDSAGAQSYLRDILYRLDPGTSTPPGAVIR